MCQPPNQPQNPSSHHWCAPGLVPTPNPLVILGSSIREVASKMAFSLASPFSCHHADPWSHGSHHQLHSVQITLQNMGFCSFPSPCTSSCTSPSALLPLKLHFPAVPSCPEVTTPPCWRVASCLPPGKSEPICGRNRGSSSFEKGARTRNSLERIRISTAKIGILGIQLCIFNFNQ